MRLSSCVAVAALLVPVAAPARAALPDPAVDCATFTTVQAVDGRTWEIRGVVCVTPGKPPKVEVTERRETNPARALKQRLVW